MKEFDSYAFEKHGVEAKEKWAAADSVEAQNLEKCLQNHITESYYPCTDEILAGLGQM